MAFPTAGILDNFDRADEGPAPSPSWVNIDSGLTVVSNQCAPVDDVENVAFWDGAGEFQLAGDQEVYVTVPTLPAASDGKCVIIGWVDGGGDGYVLYLIYSGGSWNWLFNRLDAYVGTALWATTVSASNGIKFGFRSRSGQHEIFADTGSGWTLQTTVSDNTHADSYYGWLSTNSSATRLDDYGGGAFIQTGNPYYAYAQQQ